MSESTQEWILKRRHEDLGVTVRMCWDLYIKFYTVFLTFSVVGLGWILTRPGDAQHSPRETGYCRRLFDPDDPDGGNKRRNRAYTVHVAPDQEHIEDLLTQSDAGGRPSITPAVPALLAQWGGWCNWAAMLAMAVLWFYVGFIR